MQGIFVPVVLDWKQQGNHLFLYQIKKGSAPCF